MKKLSPLARAEACLFVPLLFEPEHVAREVFERTVEVPLHVAHGVRRRIARPGMPMERRIGGGRPRYADREPLLLFPRQRWRQGLQQHPAVVRRLAERFLYEHARRLCIHRVQLEPERLDVFQKRRPRNNRVVLEREGGDRDATSRQP